MQHCSHSAKTPRSVKVKEKAWNASLTKHQIQLQNTQQSIGKEGYEYHGELASSLARFCQMVSVEIANRKRLNMNAAVEYNTNSMANTQQSSELGSRQSNRRFELYIQSYG
jgi:hypothetical protein